MTGATHGAIGGLIGFIGGLLGRMYLCLACFGIGIGVGVGQGDVSLVSAYVMLCPYTAAAFMGDRLSQRLF